MPLSREHVLAQVAKFINGSRYRGNRYVIEVERGPGRLSQRKRLGVFAVHPESLEAVEPDSVQCDLYFCFDAERNEIVVSTSFRCLSGSSAGINAETGEKLWAMMS